MATVHSIMNGKWSNGLTWNTLTVPTAEDTVTINHNVTIETGTATAKEVHISTFGSLSTSDSWDMTTEVAAEFDSLILNRKLNDKRRVSLDGIKLAVGHPVISCYMPSSDGFPSTGNLEQNDARDIIIDDPGHLSCSARLRDILPEGCAPAYAEKISNAVRYVTATVHIRASKPYYLGQLYRMARGPFQVLLATSTCVIKGFIENITPDPASVGKEYITVRVTIAEGPGA